MSNLSNASIVIVVIGGILGLVFYVVSSPTIMIAMNHPDSTLYGGQDIPISIYSENNRLWSQVCFRIENQGQAIPSGEIPASNFQVSINTNAICEECNSFTNFQTLGAQESKAYCERVKMPLNSKELTFEINAKYDAIIPRTVGNTFVCELTEVGDTESKFVCN
ncbi:hypothetical protein [Nitrosopumilus sp.]|uniref:hypothetical protein n=1 Tax=Nitrosopumilus sp. TaxID=2024843 RepID=UPI00349FDD14